MMLEVLEEVLEGRGYTYIQYAVLSSLRDGAAVNPKDICFQFGHDAGALTRVIDLLADRGLLARVRCNPDRRKVDLQLTAVGLQTIEELVPVVREKINLALLGFSKEELATFLQSLQKLNRQLESTLNERRVTGN
jgi:DNA-binding MarR family transcriptional regulator